MNLVKVLKAITILLSVLVLIVGGILTFQWVNGMNDPNTTSNQSEKVENNQDSKNSNDSEEQSKQLKNNHEDKKGLKSKDDNTLYDEVDVQMDVIDEEHIHASYQYPLFHHDDINKVILKYVEEQKALFEQESLRVNNADVNQMSTHNVNFKLNKLDKNLYTLVFENSMLVSGHNGYVQYKTWIIDNKNHNVFTFKDFIVNESKAHDILYKAIANEIKKDDEKDLYVDYDALKDFIVNNQLKAYPKGEHIVFNFNEYDVAAGALGAFSLEIKTDDIEGALTAEGKKILIDQDLSKLSEEQLAQIKVDTPENVEVPTTETPTLDEGDTSKQDHPEDESSSQEQDESSNEESEDDAVEQNEPNNGVTKTKKIALTFDDGPNGSTTPHVLEILDKFDAKATFYMVGSKVKYNQNIVKQVHERGHQIGNHTMNHPDLTTISESQVKQELNETNQLIEQAIGETPNTFRPPYGSTNEMVNLMTDMEPILWTIDTEDWKSHDPQAILEVVKANHQDGGIVLMHDIHKTTVDSLVDVLTFLSNEGYEFVTVDEVMS